MKRVLPPKSIKKLVISSLVSLLLIIVGYFANNWPILTGENILQLHVTQWVYEWFKKSQPDSDDAFFVNVSHDRELVKLKNEPVKNTAIVDRAKLYKFLKVLKEEGEYKYIVLDILFDTNECSETDSLLYPLIASMKNIVVVRDTSYAIDGILLEKSALDDYYTTMIDNQTGFLRYRYLEDGKMPTIPLKIYEDIYPKDSIKKHGLIYTSGNKLCQNACFIPFDGTTFDTYKNAYVDGYVYDLGANILEDSISLREEDGWKKILFRYQKVNMFL